MQLPSEERQCVIGTFNGKYLFSISDPLSRSTGNCLLQLLMPLQYYPRRATLLAWLFPSIRFCCLFIASSELSLILPAQSVDRRRCCWHWLSTDLNWSLLWVDILPITFKLTKNASIRFYLSLADLVSTLQPVALLLFCENVDSLPDIWTSHESNECLYNINSVMLGMTTNDCDNCTLVSIKSYVKLHIVVVSFTSIL